MDDVRLALLGDKAAQERLTERGEMLPCAHCKGKGKVSFKDYRFIGKNFEKLAKHIKCYPSYCPVCGRPLTEQAWDELEKRMRGANA